jgi:hypothetical protein
MRAALFGVLLLCLASCARNQPPTALGGPDNPLGRPAPGYRDVQPDTDPEATRSRRGAGAGVEVPVLTGD